MDGLIREQKYELLTYIGGVLVIMIYVISNYSIKGKSEDEKELRLVIISAYFMFLEENLKIRYV